MRTDTANDAWERVPRTTPAQRGARIVLALILLLFSLWAVLSRSSTVRVEVPGTPYQTREEAAEAVSFEGEDGPRDFEVRNVRQNQGRTEITLRAEGQGPAEVTVPGENGEMHRFGFEDRNVLGRKVLVREDGFFEGCFTLAIILLILIAAEAVLTGIAAGRMFLRSLYSYRMVIYTGVCIFAAMQAVMFAVLFVRDFRDATFTLPTKAVELVGKFVTVTAPVMLVCAFLLSLSNIVLLKREGHRPRNMLGIFLGAAWALGVVLLVILEQRMPGLDGSGFTAAAAVILSVAMAYFECLLAATVLSAYLAQRHRPAPDKDYICILGCAFRKDGTPTPLLAGRIDRAVAFEKEQFRKTGKHAVFVPSGGQGSDERISEAECMRRYLLTKGIPDTQILPEDKSRNTFENFGCSKKLILAKDPQAVVAFSTTNYHVFRSYVYASRNGIYAEGMAAPTKYYFFPNAFLREFAGLMAAEKVRHGLVLGAIAVLYIFLLWL